MKIALIGLSNNISDNFGKIKIWANSFRKYSSGDVILLCANSTDADMQMCKNIGIHPVPVTVADTWHINHDRLKHTEQFLSRSDIDLFVVSDVFDVIFQDDPIKKLNLDAYDIFVSGEGVTVNQEPWNADNISKIFPDHRKICGEQEVINSGVIVGKRASLIKLLNSMYQLCEAGSDAHNIKDQAALIVLVATNQIERLKIFNLDDGWAMHCAVAGPTQFFDAWNFRKAIRYGIPYMSGGYVVNKYAQKYDIVHQFNRVPEWKSILESQYL